MLLKMTDDLAYFDEIKLEPMEHIKASSSESRLYFKRTSACLNEIVCHGKLFTFVTFLIAIELGLRTLNSRLKLTYRNIVLLKFCYNDKTIITKAYTMH